MKKFGFWKRKIVSSMTCICASCSIWSKTSVGLNKSNCRLKWHIRKWTHLTDVINTVFQYWILNTRSHRMCYILLSRWWEFSSFGKRITGNINSFMCKCIPVNIQPKHRYHTKSVLNRVENWLVVAWRFGKIQMKPGFDVVTTTNAPGEQVAVIPAIGFQC